MKKSNMKGKLKCLHNVRNYMLNNYRNSYNQPVILYIRQGYNTVHAGMTHVVQWFSGNFLEIMKQCCAN